MTRASALRASAIARRPSPRPLEDHHLHGRPAPHQHGRAVVLDGPMNADACLTYVTRVLVPELDRGYVVIMDNLSSHKAPAVHAAIESIGATLLFLPPYSPDFNPIGRPFPALKPFPRHTRWIPSPQVSTPVARGFPK
jgi:transposase